ncbi:thermonuclease family protein [Thalassoglobus sp.]|uniref:thermonuclease family protein n=1 Tax=Thalassoglobus sp. TaxID=2795869 RepID=UPI003AA8B8AE
MYEYRAKIVRLIDGDTVVADVQLGFHVSLRTTFRLFGIDAPETRGVERPDGLAATEYLKRFISKLTDGSNELTIRTQKDRTGKYGRYLAELWVGDINLNEALVAAGHAAIAHY